MTAVGTQTMRTRLWDDLGPLPWPAGVDGRALRNRFSQEHPVEQLQQVGACNSLCVGCYHMHAPGSLCPAPQRCQAGSPVLHMLLALHLPSKWGKVLARDDCAAVCQICERMLLRRRKSRRS